MPDVQLSSSRRRWVIKFGSALLTDGGVGLDVPRINDWVAQMAALASSDLRIVVVSSGSIVVGMQRLGWSRRPSALNELQAAAAVGQSGLVEVWERAFMDHGLRAAQVLLTEADLSHRVRYLNARSTLRTLLKFDVVPVVNENDTVVMDEIRFGDNDTLAAMVANLVEAERLLILTDQIGLYDADPRANPEANLIQEADAGDPRLEAMATGPGSEIGRGGMLTKVRAAARAAVSGADTVIAGGRESEVITRVAAGEAVGTRLRAAGDRLAARKQWLAGRLHSEGTIVLDEGAVRVLRESGRSLLPVGVTEVNGEFDRGALVTCVAPDGAEVARGLVNYSADEARRIKGCASGDIAEILGYVDEPELLHRDNMVLT